MHFKKLIITLPLIAFSHLGLAKDSNISYNMIGLGLAKTTIDDFDFSGASLYGSIEINDNFFIVASISDSMSDDEFITDYNYYTNFYTTEKATITQHMIGLGLHKSTSTQTDIYGHLTYNEAKVEIDNSSTKANGVELTTGVRHMLNTNVELDANIGVNNGEGETDVLFDVGLRGYFTEHFSIGAKIEKSGDYHQLLGDIRYSF